MKNTNQTRPKSKKKVEFKLEGIQIKTFKYKDQNQNENWKVQSIKEILVCISYSIINFTKSKKDEFKLKGI